MMAHGAGDKTKYDIRIVGVVADYIHRTVRANPAVGMYWPAAQDPTPGGMWYYVRTRSDPDATMGLMRRAVQRIDSKLVVASLSTLDSQINDNINDDRMIALLAESFGVLAMVLAAVGLYGVLAYATAQRTREIGVRMALGADRNGIMSLVLKDVLTLAGISVAVALPVALLATRALKSLLFGVSNMDPAVVAPVTALVILVAVLAAALPARRAAQVEPMQALRME
jgi:predicted lysophospholipase L1 biosynthesis ABC-type transport system permease subunit